MTDTRDWYYHERIQLDRQLQEVQLQMTAIAALKPKFGLDGNMYYFLLGENIQEGVAGFGATVNEAAYAFYLACCNERITNPTIVRPPIPSPQS